MPQCISRIINKFKWLHICKKYSLYIKNYIKIFNPLTHTHLGYDSAELIQKLKVEIENKSETAGLDMTNGTVGDMQKLGITV